MRSSRPKPLHHLCGRAMVRYVLDAATQENVRATVVVVGHHATWVEKELSAGGSAQRPLTFVEQHEQLGTGHAVSVALATIDEAIGDTDGDVLIHAAAARGERRAPARGAPRTPSRSYGFERAPR
jgi:bifunctional UDP-N-acetylglucosamine pyrophosphorylase/glucosamine-1-phosphate N-acetyltransferase